jgi:hypothetical protein
LDFLYLKIEQFYLKELPEILKEKPVSWLFNNKCHGCTFVNKCRVDAVGTPGHIPYMTEAKVENLQLHDIEDLSNQFHSLSIDRNSTGYIHLPKEFVKAYGKDTAVVSYIRY